MDVKIKVFCLVFSRTVLFDKATIPHYLLKTAENARKYTR